MSHRQSSGARYKVEQRQLDRPGGVAIVACFQLLKAGVLVFTGMLLWWKPSVVDSSQSILYPLLYVATRGNYAALNAMMKGANLLPGLIFLLGLYLSAIGSGLWQLKKWARRNVIFTCSLTLLLWAKSTLLPSAPGVSTFPLSPDLRSFHILLLCDGVIFLYLVGGKTAAAFETRS